MQAIIISAGESTRFWPINSGHHKTQTLVLGKPVIYWTIKGLAENNITDIIVVCRSDDSMQSIEEYTKDLGVTLKFVNQEQPLGTGNALAQAKEYITQPFILIWPNKVNAGTMVKDILEVQSKEQADVVFVGATTSTPQDYGIIRFNGDEVEEIIEKPEVGTAPSDIKAIGAYFLKPEFFEYYEKLEEHHITDIIDARNAYLKDKKGAWVKLEKDVPALKYPWELFGILDILAASRLEESVADTVQIGKSVEIKGPVFIGENTIIKDNTIIEGPCYIGANCEIGYNNIIRGTVNIEDNVKTGSFCEISHSIIQEGTHFHSGYIGDSIIGKNCRFGAGFIAANRRLDRETIKVKIKGEKVDSQISRLGVVVGDEVKIGIHAGTMPGVLIGSNSKIGPGAMIFKNIGDGEVIRD